jgi:hypothetical protein
MKKIIINSLLVLSLIGTSLLGLAQPAAAAEQKSAFTDTKGHWAKAAIDAAVGKGYFKGYADGTFKPNGTVTRAEFAALLARASKAETETEPSNVFADLSGHWSEAEVNRAVALGYISASDYPNGFKPNTAITRMEIAKWMTSGLAAGAADYKKALEDTVTTVLPVKEYFKPGIPHSQSPYIAVALGTKLMKGYPDGSFGITKNATRAEASTILMNLDNVSTQPAGSFRDLNELREVGTKRTNMETITPYTTVANTSFNDVMGKKNMLTNKSGYLVMHNFLFIDAQDYDNPKSIYAPLFLNKGDRDPELEFPRSGYYRVYFQMTIYPEQEGFNTDNYYNGLPGYLYFGVWMPTGLAEKYGYMTLPNTYVTKFFSKYRDGKGVTMWLASSLITKKNSMISMRTDDGSEVTIVLKK